MLGTLDTSSVGSFPAPPPGEKRASLMDLYTRFVVKGEPITDELLSFCQYCIISSHGMGNCCFIYL